MHRVDRRERDRAAPSWWWRNLLLAAIRTSERLECGLAVAEFSTEVGGSKWPVVDPTLVREAKGGRQG